MLFSLLSIKAQQKTPCRDTIDFPGTNLDLLLL